MMDTLMVSTEGKYRCVHVQRYQWTPGGLNEANFGKHMLSAAKKLQPPLTAAGQQTTTCTAPTDSCDKEPRSHLSFVVTTKRKWGSLGVWPLHKNLDWQAGNSVSFSHNGIDNGSSVCHLGSVLKNQGSKYLSTSSCRIACSATSELCETLGFREFIA
jgi:hypothetical protein